MAGETRVEVLVEAIDRAGKVLDDLLGQLDKLDRAQGDSAAAAKKGEAAQKDLGQAIDRTGKQAEETSKAVDKVDRSQKEAERSTRKLERSQRDVAGAISRTAKQAIGLAAAYIGIREAIDVVRDVTHTGFDFNETLETAQIGIAAILMQFDESGRIKNFADALELSGAALDKLLQKAKASPATLKDLIAAYQGTAGALAAGGIRDINQQIELITLMSQGLSALGIRSEQILQETRAMVTGNITEDAQAARILGITKADIERAKEAGTLFEFLTGKLEAFGIAAEFAQDSWQVSIANMQDAWDQWTGDLTFGSFESLKPIINEISDDLNSMIDSGKVREWGIRFGAFITLLYEYWQAGNLDEIISLTLEAGIEKGVDSGKAAMVRFFESETGTIVTTAFSSAMITAVEMFVAAASDALGFLSLFSSSLTAGGRYAAQELKAGFLDAVNALAAAAETAINKIIRGIEHAVRMLPGAGDVQLGSVSVPQAAVGEGQSFDDLLLEEQMEVVDRADQRRQMIGGMFDALREGIAGVADESEASVSRWDELMTLVDEKVEEFKAKADEMGTSEGTTGGGRRGGGGATDEGAGFGGTFNVDPVVRYMEYLDELGSVGTSVAEVLQGVFNGVSSTIQGLMLGTMRWGDALANIGAHIASAVVTAFAQMAAAWITQRLAMMIFNIGADATETAARTGTMMAAATAAASVATGLTMAWTPAAVAASIATYGAAAGVGLAAFSGAMMAGVAVGAAASLVSGFLGTVAGAIGSMGGAAVVGGGGGGGGAPGYASGSFTLDKPHMAWVGEEGEEWVSNARLTKRERPFFAALDRTQNIDAAFAMTRGSGGESRDEETAVFHAVGSLQEGRKFRDRRAGRVEMQRLARGEIARYRNR